MFHEIYACGWYNKIYKQTYGKNCFNAFVDELMTVKNKIIVAYNGSSFDFPFLIMSFEFNDNKVFDLYLFINSSLDNACKSFKLNNQKLEFNHSKMTSWESVEKYRSEVEPYLKVDVLALKELFITFNDMIYEMEGINITDYITLSNMSYSIWSNKYLSEEIEIFD